MGISSRFDLHFLLVTDACVALAAITDEIGETVCLICEGAEPPQGADSLLAYCNTTPFLLRALSPFPHR